MVKASTPRQALEAAALSAEEAKAALAFIEQHLFQPLDVKTIAAACGVSPFRFSRQFAARQGESVMAFVRGRRLEAAARRLLTEPDARLVDLAFDCGFDSQEAFTRAFARAFGAAPGRFRRTGAIETLARRRKKRMQLDIRESVEDLTALALAGLSAHFTPATTVEMSGLWARLVPLMGFAGQLGGRQTYGVWTRRHPADGSFDFLAGVRVEPGSAPPAPLEALTLPARRYLVFKQMLVEGELHPQMLAATEEIWSERLPRSGHRLADAPDFQIYPADFKVEPGGWVAHYLPIVE
ncbi:helix-turn-helix domain-containing protein [Phenylobacterium terrae]|uniref:Helix-turn-helix domain-containing protein n=1 Tax=Phenylobacterium terrae TaxID=2665495 RepID=A0ABW4N3U7_9CAUL